MKFFIPAAADEAQAQRVFDAIKDFLRSELGADFDHRRIFILRYVHGATEYAAEVGQLHSLNNEPVIAILHEPRRNLYHICTTNRGVARGMSILVGVRSVKACEDFEDN